MNCIFCNIILGKIPATIVYRDDLILAFDDIEAKAPHHKLIIPVKHIATLNEVQEEEKELLGHMVWTASLLAKQCHIATEGYRLVWNCHAGAGQSVFHIHLHLLGGRPLHWPPG